MPLQEIVNNLASLVTRYDATEEWNKQDAPYPKVTILRRKEVEAIRQAISLLMGE